MSQAEVEYPAAGSTPTGTSTTNLQDSYQRALRSGDLDEMECILLRFSDCVNVNVFDRDGQTALHHGCLNGNLALVKLLIQSGANVKLSNRDGWSALHIAAFGGHQDIALYLLANSAR